MKTIPQAQKGYKGSHDPLPSMNCWRLEREDIRTHQYQFLFAGDCNNNQVTGKIIIIRDSRPTISKHNTIATCTHNTFYVKNAGGVQCFSYVNYVYILYLIWIICIVEQYKVIIVTELQVLHKTYLIDKQYYANYSSLHNIVMNVTAIALW